MICQLQNAKSNLPKFCKVYARLKKQNTNLVHLYIHLLVTFAIILNSKIVFNNLLKVVHTKEIHYMHLTPQYLVVTKRYTY